MEGGQEQESLKLFLSWATKLGITDSPQDNLLQSDTQTSPSSSCLRHSICKAHFPNAGGRGLAAARYLRKTELILRVPKSALMTTQSLTAKDQKLASCTGRYRHLSSNQILGVCLLNEMNKGKSSWWYPYLMQLPRYYDTLASFSEFETQALQVDDAIWATERAISKVKSDWEQALPLMRELQLRGQILTLKSWIWASETVSSRTMHVPWDDAGCLCPVGDYFNYAAPGDEFSCSAEDGENRILQSSVHSESRDANDKVDVKQLEGRLTDAGYVEDLDAYCFYARTNYKKGEQVLLSYGTYTNLELLEHYGFHLNTNPNEKAFIPLQSGIHSNSWPKDSLYIQWDGTPSFALLSALRLWTTPPNQRKYFNHLAYSGSQLSVENEKVVMKWLLANCQSVLDRLPSSMEEDVVLIDFIENMNDSRVYKIEQMRLGCRDELREFVECNKLWKECSDFEFGFTKKARRSAERWKLAVQWRLSYKNILTNCMSFCKESLEILSSTQLISCKRIGKV